MLGMAERVWRVRERRAVGRRVRRRGEDTSVAWRRVERMGMLIDSVGIGGWFD